MFAKVCYSVNLTKECTRIIMTQGRMFDDEMLFLGNFSMTVTKKVLYLKLFG